MLPCTAFPSLCRSRESRTLSHLYLTEVDSGSLVGSQKSDGAVPVLAFDLHVHGVALSLDI